MQSSWTLAILTVVAVLAYLAADASRISVTTPMHDEKVAAARWMQTAIDSLRRFQYQRGRFPDEVNDPALTNLIGQQYTQITTEPGDIEAKWTALNPNMAAAVIEYFRRAGLKSGDMVAAGMSGSLTGMNLAFYAACETMGIVPIVITSVGASSWGANDPFFTWLDMERILREKGLLHHISQAASYGGGNDLGRSLSPDGRSLIYSAIKRNGIWLIRQPTLEESIQRRMDHYLEQTEGRDYSLYVNVGGGVASIGHSRNSDLIGHGLNLTLPDYNYPKRGVIHEFSDMGIPVLHLGNIAQIAEEFGLPVSPVALPTPGIGPLFSEERYNSVVTSFALLAVLATLVFVLINDRFSQRFDREGVDPDTLI